MFRFRTACVPALLILSAAPLRAGDDIPVHTFSIVAFDERTGDLGVAVASRVLGVGAIVPYVEADVGAVATQAMANSSFGPRGLAMLRGGQTPDAISMTFQDDDARIARRQFGIVNADGRAAAFTGDECIPFAGHIIGDGYTIQGNLLAGEEVLKAMKLAFDEAKAADEGELADWLLAALTAGEAAGGDKRGKQAAALIVARKGAGYDGNDRYIDLRVDDHVEPASELARLLGLHKELFHFAHENPPKRSTLAE